MKPDGNDARRAVGPDVCQARWNVRCQKFLCDWMLKKTEISLLDGHGVLLMGWERCRGLAVGCRIVRRRGSLVKQPAIRISLVPPPRRASLAAVFPPGSTRGRA